MRVLGQARAARGQIRDWGCILDPPRGQASSRGETKDFSLFSSRDGYFLEPTEWTKGSQASSGVWREDSGLHSRTCRKRRPSSHDDGGGGSRWFYRAAAPVLVSQEVQRGAQGASCVAPGKLGLDACGKVKGSTKIRGRINYLKLTASVPHPCQDRKLYTGGAESNQASVGEGRAPKEGPMDKGTPCNKQFAIDTQGGKGSWKQREK